jgi:hypothetical protein
METIQIKSLQPNRRIKTAKQQIKNNFTNQQMSNTNQQLATTKIRAEDRQMSVYQAATLDWTKTKSPRKIHEHCLSILHETSNPATHPTQATLTPPPVDRQAPVFRRQTSRSTGRNYKATHLNQAQYQPLSLCVQKRRSGKKNLWSRRAVEKRVGVPLALGKNRDGTQSRGRSGNVEESYKRFVTDRF